MLKPVCYAILGKSGMWMSESCICEDADVLQAELEYAREEKPSEDYKIVPLYTRPAGKVDELLKAHAVYLRAKDSCGLSGDIDQAEARLKKARAALTGEE